MQLHVAQKQFQKKSILSNVKIDVKAGETTVLFGPSGCGKTTLLNIISGLDNNFEGRIEGRAQRIGMVFQEPNLLPWLSVRENIDLVVEKNIDIEKILNDLGIMDVADLPASKLSLGMARRVAFARALSVSPDLLIMDEPFVSLDAIFVTHDLKEAVQLGNRILFLDETLGRIIREVNITLSSVERCQPIVIENYSKQFALS